MSTRNIRSRAIILGLGLLLAGCQPVLQQADQRLAGTDLIFGPYVSAVSAEAASVHWVSPAGVDGSCRMLDEAASAKVIVRTEPIAGRTEVRHTAVVTGLAADRRHRYVVTSGRERAEGSFRTPPPAGSRRPFTFAVYGDTQSNLLRIRSVDEAILGDAPVFVIHTGDLTNDGQKWPLWEAHFFGPARELLRKAPLWPARGNHEYGTEPFASLFGLSATQPWYSFDYDNLHVVVLDQWNVEGSERMEADRLAEMAAWLDEDLTAARDRADWILVTGHQPMLNVAGHGSMWGYETILPILYKHGVDVVAGGHSHLWERFVPVGPAGAKPIQFLVSGGGGARNYPSAPSPILVKSVAVPHYCLYRVEGDRLEVTVKGTAGSVIDRLVLTRERGQVSRNIAEATIPPEDAKALLKVFKRLRADFDGPPVSGRPLACSLRPGSFPEGSTVRVSADPGRAWAVGETTFQAAAGESASLEVIPPADVLLDAGSTFSPALTLAVSLDYKGHSYSCTSVPVQVNAETLRRLVPRPEPVDVPPAVADGMVVDGDLAEWADVPPLYLPSIKGPARSLKLAWNVDGLYGAVVAKQQGIHNDHAPWNADSLEVNVEADARRRQRMSSRGRPVKFFLWPTAGADGGKASYRRMTGKLSRRAVQAAWRKTPSGYTMEFRIAATQLSESPLAAGKRMGLDLILRRDGVVVEQFADTRAFRSTWSSPVYWGAIRLFGSSGVAPRTAQAAMRHSTIDLTMNVYADPRLLDAAGAEALLGLAVESQGKAEVQAGG